ncbi:MAG TPA: O-antigen ligase family protein [Frankiaceae bacterium]|nr:O-antigen ligase family protein [Frankiaceae bacterium]
MTSLPAASGPLQPVRAVEPVGPRYVVTGPGNLPAPIAVLVCALAYAAFSQGAFYVRELVTCTALLAAAAVATARAHGRSTVNAVPFVAVLAAAWAVASATLGGNAAAAAGPVALALCAGAAFVVVRAGSRSERESFATALLAVGCCVAVLGWLGVVLRVVPLALPDQQLWRAASSLTYANATAGLLVPLARLTERRALATRVAATLLLTGTLATLSRAGYLALAIGGVVLAARGGGVRRLVAAGWRPSLGALVAFAGLLPSMPASAPPRPFVALLALAGGVAAQALPRDRRTVQAVAGTAAALVVLAAFGAAEPLADATRRVGAARVTVASPDRAGEWSATWRVAREHPVTGVGPGNLDISWPAADGRLVMRAHYTHNEYLQLFAEQGAVGLALALALLAAAARSLRRTRREDAAPDWLAAGAAAALAAFLVHSAFDFVWHIPLIPLAVLAVVAAAGPAVDRKAVP